MLRDGVEMWSEWQAGIPHPLVTSILILAWAIFLICLENWELPYSFLAALPSDTFENERSDCLLT